MNIRRSFYILVVVCALISVGAWLKITYPRFSQMDFSVSRAKAVDVASAYVRNKEHIDLSTYKMAVVFNEDTAAGRYLQKSLGLDGSEQFIKKHSYDLFVWSVRFFKEGQKQEYRVIVSARTGEVLSFNHAMDDSAERKFIDEESAQRKAEAFLKDQLRFDLRDYVFNSKTSAKFDHRLEYTFNWEKKGVYVTWDKDPNSGGGKFLTTVVVSGDDVPLFNKLIFAPPDQFNRDIESRKESGRNLGLVANVGGMLFFVGAIWIMVLRRNHLAMNVTKRFYIKVIVALFILAVFSGINNAESYIFQYPTTQPLVPYLVRLIINEISNRFFFLICFVIPCLAGELLCFEMFPKYPQRGMFHYLTTTFLSRDLALTIVLSYCFAIIMIGLQSAIFECGYRYCDVWVEQTRLSRLSTGYWPFLGVLTLAVNASLTEETFFRLFGLSFGVKFFRFPVVAVLVSSIVWGLGHTGYMVFPFWFRGLEVTILGIFTAIVYLRFGLICAVVQHFLFDAFWASSPYIFGHSLNADFMMSLFVLFVPLAFALYAYISNRPVVKTKVEWRLNAQQKFNLEILKGFIKRQSQQGASTPDALRAQLIHHGWDVAVVDVAFQQLSISVQESTANGS